MQPRHATPTAAIAETTNNGDAAHEPRALRTRALDREVTQRCYRSQP